MGFVLSKNTQVNNNKNMGFAMKNDNELNNNIVGDLVELNRDLCDKFVDSIYMEIFSNLSIHSHDLEVLGDIASCFNTLKILDFKNGLRLYHSDTNYTPYVKLSNNKKLKTTTKLIEFIAAHKVFLINISKKFYDNEDTSVTSSYGKTKDVPFRLALKDFISGSFRNIPKWIVPNVDEIAILKGEVMAKNPGECLGKNNSNIVLYVAKNKELAVKLPGSQSVLLHQKLEPANIPKKFVDPNKNRQFRNNIHGNTPCTHEGANNKNVLFFPSYCALDGEWAVNFISQKRRDAFIEYLGLEIKSNQYHPYTNQTSTTYKDSDGNPLFTIYTGRQNTALYFEASQKDFFEDNAFIRIDRKSGTVYKGRLVSKTGNSNNNLININSVSHSSKKQQVETRVYNEDKPDFNNKSFYVQRYTHFSDDRPVSYLQFKSCHPSKDEIQEVVKLFLPMIKPTKPQKHSVNWILMYQYWGVPDHIVRYIEDRAAPTIEAKLMKFFLDKAKQNKNVSAFAEMIRYQLLRDLNSIGLYSNKNELSSQIAEYLSKSKSIQRIRKAGEDLLSNEDFDILKAQIVSVIESNNLSKADVVKLLNHNTGSSKVLSPVAQLYKDLIVYLSTLSQDDDSSEKLQQALQSFFNNYHVIHSGNYNALSGNNKFNPIADSIEKYCADEEFNIELAIDDLEGDKENSAIYQETYNGTYQSPAMIQHLN